MKKYFTSNDYKRQNTKRAENRLKQRLLSDERKKVLRRNISGGDENEKVRKRAKSNSNRRRDVLKPAALASSDLRLIENTEKCLSFFRDLRSDEYQSIRKNIKFVIMSLKEVTKIDYGTISVLTAINDELRFKRIILKTILPENPDSKQFMIDSGYLNNLFDERGKPFVKAEKSDLIFFEKGCGILSEVDNRKISLLVRNVIIHLTGVSNYCLPVKTIILEICGNSIEWSGTESKQWLLGVKYENNNVVFTVTDVGRGILETLYRRFSKRFFDTFNSTDEVLKGAFDKKYGSTTQEINRNKGLPAVKTNFTSGAINNLKVLTNNVILHFDDDTLSRTFNRGSPRFKGTFYQWEMNNDCLNKLMN